MRRIQTLAAVSERTVVVADFTFQRDAHRVRGGRPAQKTLRQPKVHHSKLRDGGARSQREKVQRARRGNLVAKTTFYFRLQPKFPDTEPDPRLCRHAKKVRNA